MAQTPPTPVTAAPTTPDRTARSTFPGQMFAFFTWMAGALVTGINNLATNVYNNALDAFNNASAAAGSASGAANSATAAGNSALTAGAIAWVSGTTYAIGDARYSPIDFRTYRRRTNGAGVTDPSADTANWAKTFPDVISTVASITAATTLTSGSAAYQAVAMVALGQSVTLPPANTLTVGGPKYIIDNSKGGYPVGVRDSAGTLLQGVAAGGEAYLSLKDNSTAAGVWSVTGAGLEPGLITIDNTFSSTFLQSNMLPQFAALDNNTSIHFAVLASGFAAFIVDNTGKVVNTPVTVSAGAGMVPLIAFKIDATHAAVFYSTPTFGTLNGVVLTVSGASPTLALAVGTPSATLTAVGAGLEDFVSPAGPRIAQLDTNLFLVSYATATGAGTTSVAAFQVSGGTTITLGAAVNIIAASNCLNSTTTRALTTLTGFVTYKSGAAPFVNNGVVISVTNASPPVCTVGAPASLTGLGSSTGTPPNTCQLSATKVLVQDDNNVSGSVIVNVFTIAGTVVTAGTAVTIETGCGANTGLAGGNNTATRYNPHLWPVSANTAGLWYMDATTNVSRVAVVSEAAGVMSAGAIFYGSLSTAGGTGNNAGTIMPQGANEYISIKAEVPVANMFRFRIAANKIAGTTVTAGACASEHLDVISLSQGSTAEQQGAVRLASGDYSIVPSGNTYLSAFPVFRSNGDAINYRGDINCPSGFTGGGASGRPVAFSNRMVILQNTNYTGQTGGASAFLLRLLNVEIAA